MIYLASPIDASDGRSVLRGMAHDALLKYDLAWYDPSTRPFGNAKADSHTAYAINDFALSECEALLALLPTGVGSIGVPMEIARAHTEDKPVAVVRPVGSPWSMQLDGMGIPQFTTPEEAVRYLKQEMSRRSEPGVLDVSGGTFQSVRGYALLDQPDPVFPPREKPRMVASVLPIDPPVLRWVGEVDMAPTRHYEGDAAWDLRVARDVTVHANQFVDVDLGISVELPNGVWAMLTGRSSTLRKRKLLVTQGIIDNGYRGPLYAGVQSLGEKVHLKRGERIAQLIPFALESRGMVVERVQDLSASDRGANGFGSTGA